VEVELPQAHAHHRQSDQDQAHAQHRLPQVVVVVANAASCTLDIQADLHASI